MRNNLLILSFLVLLTGFGLLVFAQRSTTTSGDCEVRQECSPPGIPDPTSMNPPTYDYWEADSCTSCHFLDNGVDDFVLEAVGVTYSDTAKAFSFTGRGWFASRHSQSNHGSTQNTFCTKCHSPMQAQPNAFYNNGFFVNTDLIPDGYVEGVTCSSCHSPIDSVSAQLGSHVTIYRFGDVTNPASFIPLREDQYDLLCLNCHITRHNGDNVAFERMYDAGVRCVDCHMAPYGTTETSSGDTMIKRAHDFKVAQNLPYSCGVQGSLAGFTCHGEFSTEATLAFLPYLKQQHEEWWPLNPAKSSRAAAALNTPADYRVLWQELEARVKRTRR